MKSNISEDHNAVMPSYKELEQARIDSIEKVERRVHSCAIIHWVIKVCHMKYSHLSAIIAGTIVSVSVWCIGWLVNRIATVPSSLKEAEGLIAGSLLVGLAYWIINFINDTTLKMNGGNIFGLLATRDGLRAVQDWFEKRFSMRSQIICSLVVAVLAVLSVKYFLGTLTEVGDSAGFYVTVFIGMFAIGNGVYCCLKCPTLTKSLVEYRLRLYPYDPASTIGVQDYTAMFGRLSLGCGFIVTVIMLLIAFLRPWQDQTRFIPALIWLGLGWAAVTYCFFFPFALLSKVIRKEKQIQLKKLEDLIRNRTSEVEIERLSKEEFDSLKKLIDLRDSVAKAKDIPIDTASLRNYLSSLILPLVSLLIANRAVFGKLFRL